MLVFSKMIQVVNVIWLVALWYQKMQRRVKTRFVLAHMLSSTALSLSSKENCSMPLE